MSQALQSACQVLEDAVRGDAPMPDADIVERLLALASGAAAAIWDEQDGPARLELGTGLGPTEAARVAGALLEAADIELFELALWQMWGTSSEKEAGDRG